MIQIKLSCLIIIKYNNPSKIDVEIGSLGTNTNTILSSNDESFNPVTKKDKFHSIINSIRV